MTVDKDSPQYFVKHWRNVSQETEGAMDDFLWWLEYDLENSELPELPDSEFQKIKALVDEFLGRREMKKIKQGEAEMLARWKNE